MKLNTKKELCKDAYNLLKINSNILDKISSNKLDKLDKEKTFNLTKETELLLIQVQKIVDVEFDNYNKNQEWLDLSVKRTEILKCTVEIIKYVLIYINKVRNVNIEDLRSEKFVKEIENIYMSCNEQEVLETCIKYIENNLDDLEQYIKIISTLDN